MSVYGSAKAIRSFKIVNIFSSVSSKLLIQPLINISEGSDEIRMESVLARVKQMADIHNNTM